MDTEIFDKFIKWICKKFDMGAENNLIRDFEKETRTCLDAEKQIKREEKEKEWEKELLEIKKVFSVLSGQKYDF